MRSRYSTGSAPSRLVRARKWPVASRRAASLARGEEGEVLLRHAEARGVAGVPGRAVPRVDVDAMNPEVRGEDQRRRGEVRGAVRPAGARGRRRRHRTTRRQGRAPRPRSVHDPRAGSDHRAHEQDRTEEASGARDHAGQRVPARWLRVRFPAAKGPRAPRGATHTRVLGATAGAQNCREPAADRVARRLREGRHTLRFVAATEGDDVKMTTMLAAVALMTTTLVGCGERRATPGGEASAPARSAASRRRALLPPPRRQRWSVRRPQRASRPRLPRLRGRPRR